MPSRGASCVTVSGDAKLGVGSNPNVMKRKGLSSM